MWGEKVFVFCSVRKFFHAWFGKTPILTDRQNINPLYPSIWQRKYVNNSYFCKGQTFCWQFILWYNSVRCSYQIFIWIYALKTFGIWAFKSHKYVLYFSALSKCVQTGNSTNTRLTLQHLNLLLNKLDGAMFQCSLCFLLLYNRWLFQSFD